MGQTEAKWPHAGKEAHEGKGVRRGKEAHIEVNFKRGGGQKKFSLSPRSRT